MSLDVPKDSVDLHARAGHEALLEFGFEVDVHAVRGQIGKGGDPLMPVFLTPEALSRVGAKMAAFRRELWRPKYLDRVRPFHEVREPFQKLKAKGHPLAVASSRKKDELATYLELFKVQDRVDVRATSDDAKRSKPHLDTSSRSPSSG